MERPAGKAACCRCQGCHNQSVSASVFLLTWEQEATSGLVEQMAQADRLPLSTSNRLPLLLTTSAPHVGVLQACSCGMRQYDLW